MSTQFFSTFTRLALFLGLIVSLTLVSCNKNEFTPTPDEVDTIEAADETVIAGKYIVVFKDSYLAPSKRNSPVFRSRDAKASYSEAARTKATDKITAFAQKQLISEEKIERIYTAALSGFAAELTAEEVKTLKANPNVKAVEQDRIVELTPELEAEIKEKPQDYRAQYTTCAISNAGGPGSGPSSKWIWIVDSGIDLDHSDLNVQTSPTYARSFVGGSANDCHGHGTHVAGIAAAKNNGFGVVGVSAGARVVPVKVFSQCWPTRPTSSTSTIIAGIDHVARYDISGDVTNLSLGGYFGIFWCGTFSSYKSAVETLANAGNRVAIAAGNSSDNAGNYQPACLNGNNIYTVSAMRCNRSFDSSYSNYNMDPVDYIATGTSVYSTNINNGYTWKTGTSMAAPVVAGILHARQAAPRTCGWTSFNGEWYPQACR